MLTKEQAAKRKILILVGRGKDTLTEWSMGTYIIRGINTVLKNTDVIKKKSLSHNVVIHLKYEDDIKKLPAGIKRRSLIFKIDF